MVPEKIQRYSFESFRQIEKETEEKWEFYKGELVNLAGGTPNHSLLQSKMNYLLVDALKKRGSKCNVYSSDLRIAVGEEKYYFYPDLSVFCEPPIPSKSIPSAVINPKVIIEVISESSEHRDRGIKFRSYRELESLDTYILLDQYGPLVEAYTKEDENVWRFEPVLGPDKIIQLPSLGIEIAVKDIYEGIQFESPDGSEVHEAYGIYITEAMRRNS